MTLPKAYLTRSVHISETLFCTQILFNTEHPGAEKIRPAEEQRRQMVMQMLTGHADFVDCVRKGGGNAAKASTKAAGARTRTCEVVRACSTPNLLCLASFLCPHRN